MRNNLFCRKPIINVLLEPKKSSKVSSQLIYGEKFQIISRKKNYFKIKNLYDGYVGYIKIDKYRSNHEPTHKVKFIKSKIYLSKKGNISPSNSFLPFLSEIEILKSKKNMIMFEKNKWINRKEILPINSKVNNYRKIFRLFLNCPYKWGGKSYKGIDCSALIQICLNFNNKFCPRDTKDQVKYFKKKVKIKNIKKNDIIFWKGHVALAISNKKLIHAYGPMKKTVIMDIKKTIKRIDETANLKVTGIKRL